MRIAKVDIKLGLYAGDREEWRFAILRRRRNIYHTSNSVNVVDDGEKEIQVKDEGTQTI